MTFEETIASVILQNTAPARLKASGGTGAVSSRGRKKLPGDFEARRGARLIGRPTAGANDVHPRRQLHSAFRMQHWPAEAAPFAEHVEPGPLTRQRHV